MRKHLILLGILCLILPILFLGCSGDDGATGATGATGPEGPPGTGLQVAEGCLVCHGAGKIVDVAEAHDPPTGSATANITSASFNPADNTASITFTFAATDSSGNPLPDDILLTPGSNPAQLAHARFTIARLVPGQELVGPFGPYETSNEWFFYPPRSHRSPSQLTFIGGVYTFTFMDVPLALGQDGFTHRVGIEIYGLPGEVRSVNPTFTFVPNQGILPEEDYVLPQTRDIVTTAACNECHNPLGYTPPSGFTSEHSFHSSRRVETKYCGLCHNPNNPLAPQSVGGTEVPIPFAKLVHGIHTAQDLLIFEDSENVGDFTEVLFPPEDVRICTKCHKGAADSDNWKTVPGIVACGSCHTDVNFTTGANHPVGAVPSDSCGSCHNPNFIDIEKSHRTLYATPNNPDVPDGLANFEYHIDNMTVDAAGVASVTFWIKKDGAFVNLNSAGDNVARRPTGFSNGPSFILAWALPQDGVDNPVDYTNTNSPVISSTNGNGAGDALNVPIFGTPGLPITTTDNQVFTATLPSDRAFPDGAKMRAVAIQGTFTQLNVDLDGALDNVARRTPSVVWPPPDALAGFNGDAVRRQVVKSGYVDNFNQPVTDPAAFSTARPIGCLECHETLQLHGGSRVNNVQVCVMCHNPNKSSSGRTVDPSIIRQEVIDALGNDPLTYPEATNNFKNMIHGIHRASDRPYEFVRNRVSGGLAGFYYNWSEVTFPGNLMDCTKCHIGDSYVPSSIPANVLPNVERTTTGNLDETRDEIIAVRGTVPNDTDLVDSPIAGACYYCHDSNAAASHMALNGGKLFTKRTDVFLEFPTP